MGETVLRGVQIQILDGRRTLQNTQRNTSPTYHWRAFLGSARCCGTTTFMLWARRRLEKAGWFRDETVKVANAAIVQLSGGGRRLLRVSRAPL